jgi:tryptophan synthase alpha subunit
VVGSAIVQLIEQNPGNEASAVEGFVRSLKACATSVGASQS